MKPVRKELLEGCLPSAPEYRYVLSEPWTAELIAALRRLGQLDYYADFPRPFFRLRMANGVQMKGIEGEPLCRVLFPGEAAGKIEEFEAELACLAGRTAH